MTDIFLPSSVEIARVAFRYMDSTGLSRNPYTGTIRSMSLLGDRLGARIDLSPAGGRGTVSGLQNRARMMQFVARLQGQQNRAYLYDRSYVQRGSFPSVELHIDPDFTKGGGNWNSAGSWTRTVNDQVMRATRNTAGTSSVLLQPLVAVSVTNYLPYVSRFASLLGAGLDQSTFKIRVDDSTPGNGVQQNWSGLNSGVLVSTTGSLIPRFVNNVPTAIAPGSFIEFVYASLSQCFLADNSPNGLLWSDDISNAAWAKTRSSVGGTTTDARGGSTALTLIEDATATQTHLVGQNGSAVSSTVNVNCAFSVELKANTRTFALVAMNEATGGTNISASFNLSTGALGANGVGGNWANLRTFSENLGNGWFRYTVVGTKTNAATAINCRVYLESADNVSTYTGDGTSSIFMGRAGFDYGTLQQTNWAAFPFVPALTTTVINTGTVPSGNSMNVKALPPSTVGLLLAGDQVEILTSYGSELKIVTASLNSNEAGLGTLVFSPRLRGTVADEGAVIPYRPMGRFIYSSGTDTEWTTDPGFMSTASFEFEEAVG